MGEAKISLYTPNLRREDFVEYIIINAFMTFMSKLKLNNVKMFITVNHCVSAHVRNVRCKEKYSANTPALFSANCKH